MAKKTGGLGKGLDDLFLDNDTEPTSEGGVMIRLKGVEPNASEHSQDRS